MKPWSSDVPKGRPREFDADKALNRALMVFWRNGYEGTSLMDLTKAMNINRPSLYAAFGNKESLFRKVLDRYTQGPVAFVLAALDAPTARTAVESFLGGMVRRLTDPRNPRGCLIVQGALTCGNEANSIRKELMARRGATEAAIRRRFQQAKSDGDLPPSANPADLARFVATVIHGLAVQAASGAKRAELQRVAQTALRAFPS
jgi:AcrR family transcriptional regulator